MRPLNVEWKARPLSWRLRPACLGEIIDWMCHGECKAELTEVYVVIVSWPHRGVYDRNGISSSQVMRTADDAAGE